MKKTILSVTAVFSVLVPTKASVVNDLNLKVAIIDTGIDPSAAPKVCDNGQHDLTGDGMEDRVGHGTNISGIIDRAVRKLPYCQILIKYYVPNEDRKNLDRTVEALEKALELEADIINYSSTGDTPDLREKMIIKKLLDKGVIVVVPSGNESKDLDLNCNVYPACYDKRIVVVGREKTWLGGYGTVVDRYENGTNVEGFGVIKSGTSQSTANATAKIIKDLLKEED